MAQNKVEKVILIVGDLSLSSYLGRYSIVFVIKSKYD